MCRSFPSRSPAPTLVPTSCNGGTWDGGASETAGKPCSAASAALTDYNLSRSPAHRAWGSDGEKGHLRSLDLAACRAPQLSHRLDGVLHPMDVVLGEVAAAGVQGKAAPGPLQLAIRDEGAALSPRAESQLIEGHQGQRG